MFYYHALHHQTLAEPPVSVIVVEGSAGPLRAVLWNTGTSSWTFSPDVVAPILYDDRNFDRWTNVDRRRAEEIARDLGTELPSEEELHRMCEEGETARQRRTTS